MDGQADRVIVANTQIYIYKQFQPDQVSWSLLNEHFKYIYLRSSCLNYVNGKNIMTIVNYRKEYIHYYMFTHKNVLFERYGIIIPTTKYFLDNVIQHQ